MAPGSAGGRLTHTRLAQYLDCGNPYRTPSQTIAVSATCPWGVAADCDHLAGRVAAMVQVGPAWLATDSGPALATRNHVMNPRGGNFGGHMDTYGVDLMGRRRRRRRSAAFKMTVIEECMRPGVSMAAVALAHGLNANRDCGAMGIFTNNS